MMSSYAYLTMISSAEHRSLYMALLEGSAAFGVFLGLVGGGELFQRCNLATTAYTSSSLSLLPVLVTLIFTTEVPRVTEEHEQARSTSWSSRVGVRRMLDAIKCVFKRRQHFARLKLNLCYLTNFAVGAAATGFGADSFLFFHKQFGLSIAYYGIFFGYLMAIVAIGGPIILKILCSYFKLRNTWTAMLSACFLAVGYVIMCLKFIPSVYGFWIGGIFLAFQSVVYAPVRDYAAKLVDTSEIGKIFAYDAMLVVIMQISSTILFKWLYSVTVEKFDGFFLVFCASLCLTAGVALIVITRIDKLETHRVPQISESSPLIT